MKNKNDSSTDDSDSESDKSDSEEEKEDPVKKTPVIKTDQEVAPVVKRDIEPTENSSPSRSNKRQRRYFLLLFVGETKMQQQVDN